MLGTTIIHNGTEKDQRLLREPLWNAVHSCRCSDGLHHVLTSSTARFRLWQPVHSLKDLPEFIVPDDALGYLRSEALYRFQLVRRGFRLAAPCPNIAPSSYQRRRLVIILNMLDGRDAGATIRDLAFCLVYRNSKTLKGAEWKASGEKRHTLRLLRAALSLRSGGYRTFPGFDGSIVGG